MEAADFQAREVLKDIRTRYTLGYFPEANNGGRSLRHIRVHVPAPDHARLITVTRGSYRRRFRERTKVMKLRRWIANVF
jgi:hypothetical protein